MGAREGLLPGGTLRLRLCPGPRTPGSLSLDGSSHNTLLPVPCSPPGNQRDWASGSSPGAAQIWAGAQNPRAEMFLPPLSTARSPTRNPQETRTRAANAKWVLLAWGWPRVWEKRHPGRAGTGQHRQEVTCSGGASTRHAVWLQNVSEKGEERVTVSAGTLLQVLRGLCFKGSRENLPGARPWHRCPGTTFYWSSSEGSSSVGPWGMGCCPGSGRGALLGQGRCSQNRCSK